MLQAVQCHGVREPYRKGNFYLIVDNLQTRKLHGDYSIVTSPSYLCAAGVDGNGEGPEHGRGTDDERHSERTVYTQVKDFFCILRRACMFCI